MRPNNAGTASRKICEICRSKRPNQRKDGLQSTHNLEQKRKTCGFLLSLFYKCRTILYAEEPRFTNQKNKTQLRIKRNWVSIFRHKIQFTSLSDKDITHLQQTFSFSYRPSTKASILSFSMTPVWRSFLFCRPAKLPGMGTPLTSCSRSIRANSSISPASSRAAKTAAGNL